MSKPSSNNTDEVSANNGDAALGTPPLQLAPPPPPPPAAYQAKTVDISEIFGDGTLFLGAMPSTRAQWDMVLAPPRCSSSYSAPGALLPQSVGPSSCSGGLGVGRIVRCLPTLQQPLTEWKLDKKTRGERFEIFVVPVVDIASAPISQYFLDAVTFIAKSLQDNVPVFVHCEQGKSRSASIVLAFLVAVKRMSLQAAFALVRSARPVIQPNMGFVQQLAAWERTCRLLASNEGSAANDNGGAPSVGDDDSSSPGNLVELFDVDDYLLDTMLRTTLHGVKDLTKADLQELHDLHGRPRDPIQLKLIVANRAKFDAVAQTLAVKYASNHALVSKLNVANASSTNSSNVGARRGAVVETGETLLVISWVRRILAEEKSSSARAERRIRRFIDDEKLV
jgi:Dual specificity phosphatase, catalytic domain